MHPLVVTVVIDLPPDHSYYSLTLAALGHASEQLRTPIDIRVVPTNTIGDVEDLVFPGSAVVVGPGSPYGDPDAAYAVVRTARERGVPLVGT